MNIIPEPKSIKKVSNAIINPSGFKVLEVSGLSPEKIEILSKDFCDLQVSSDKKFTAVFYADSKDIDALNIPEEADSYAMILTQNGVRIDSNSETGLWYGLQTLLQIRTETAVEAVEIKDWASIPLRAVHWDMKGYQPKLEILKEELRILASYKVNMLLFEVEDKYDFATAPDIAVPGAFTRDDLRVVSRYAKALGITIIPKLQCLGHVDYMLKHERYKHLRENEHTYQFCPRNEDGFKLWTEMANELMGCFQEHKEYFHAGADETTNLGECPVCASHSKSSSFIHRVEKSLDFLIERGRTPIIWDDILRNQHGNVEEAELTKTWKLAEKAVLMYWAYGYGGNNNTFPFINLYKGQGMRFWGSSGFGGCDKWMQTVPPFDLRAQNIDAWTKSALENSVECVCVTGWTRVVSCDPPVEPQEGAWFNILYSAESTWSGNVSDYKQFIKKAAINFYGCSITEKLVEFLLVPENVDFSTKDIPKTIEGSKRLSLLYYLAAMERFSLDELINKMRMYYRKTGNSLPDHRLSSIRTFLDEFIENQNQLKAELGKLLPQFYLPETVDAFMSSRFDFNEKLVADMELLLETTSLY